MSLECLIGAWQDSFGHAVQVTADGPDKLLAVLTKENAHPKKFTLEVTAAGVTCGRFLLAQPLQPGLTELAWRAKGAASTWTRQAKDQVKKFNEGEAMQKLLKAGGLASVEALKDDRALEQFCEGMTQRVVNGVKQRADGKPTNPGDLLPNETIQDALVFEEALRKAGREERVVAWVTGLNALLSQCAPAWYVYFSYERAKPDQPGRKLRWGAKALPACVHDLEGKLQAVARGDEDAFVCAVCVLPCRSTERYSLPYAAAPAISAASPVCDACRLRCGLRLVRVGEPEPPPYAETQKFVDAALRVRNATQHWRERCQLAAEKCGVEAPTLATVAEQWVATQRRVSIDLRAENEQLRRENQQLKRRGSDGRRMSTATNASGRSRKSRHDAAEPGGNLGFYDMVGPEMWAATAAVWPMACAAAAMSQAMAQVDPMSPKTAAAVFDASYRRLSFPNVPGFAAPGYGPGQRFGPSPVSPTAYASVPPSGYNRFSTFSDSSEEWHAKSSRGSTVTVSSMQSEEWNPADDEDEEDGAARPKLGRSASMPMQKKARPAQMRRGNTAEAGILGDGQRQTPVAKRFPLVQIEESPKAVESSEPGASGFYGRRSSGGNASVQVSQPPGLRPYRQSKEAKSPQVTFGSSPQEPWGAKSKAGALLQIDSSNMDEDLQLPISSQPVTPAGTLFPPTPGGEAVGGVSPRKLSWPGAKAGDTSQVTAPAQGKGKPHEQLAARLQAHVHPSSPSGDSVDGEDEDGKKKRRRRPGIRNRRRGEQESGEGEDCPMSPLPVLPVSPEATD